MAKRNRPNTSCMAAWSQRSRSSPQCSGRRVQEVSATVSSMDACSPVSRFSASSVQERTARGDSLPPVTRQDRDNSLSALMLSGASMSRRKRLAARKAQSAEISGSSTEAASRTRVPVLFSKKYRSAAVSSQTAQPMRRFIMTAPCGLRFRRAEAAPSIRPAA